MRMAKAPKPRKTKRPSNKPRRPRTSEVRELSQGAPDARYGDQRLPQSSAREHPGGSAPPLDRKTQYKNTNEDL
jgi:hypothetical protein